MLRVIGENDLNYKQIWTSSLWIWTYWEENIHINICGEIIFKHSKMQNDNLLVYGY
jgi:hypothetical protein